MSDRAAPLPVTRSAYMTRAAPRLARMDAIADRCAFDKWPSERTADEQRFWDEHARLLAEQMADEVAEGF
jgi:hypothetical protein